MSEGASSSTDAAVKLRVKRRSDDNSNSESATKRLHNSTRDVVMLLDGSDVGHAVEQCRTVCHGEGTFLVDVND